ncbi:MAG: isoprenylcysteine carboxylmethyltransferase family protein [Salegentibacter sp.]|uniref:Protein-S-isoprenylcysteine O-methyltransferase Ste14 n=1 Tax=Salegentibacter flavus TaxID=287099 RepID=A0A1I5BQI7_9FLAO|nr:MULTISPECIES: isoprenylcysteine carboxylmethyltransferase family protein [Salegentibacter]MDR9457718.1 isoprenylcysteine carboxylmethyltransferase family protein [Salegentibacter sp.]SFN76691.1 Protein-S-isoprenylcysteine O-methyltransferase Ste14 [Salegentibacter flavus]
MNLKAKDIAYVGLQLTLFLSFLLDISLLSFRLPVWIDYLLLPLILIGGGVVLLALLQLKTNLSIFPSPLRGSNLITHGLFKYVRHPIYSGILLSAFALALYLGSGYKLLIAFLLLILFYFKSSYEEKLLLQKFPEYKEYMKRSGRFLPGI